DATGLYIFRGLSSLVFRCVEKTNLILIHSNKLNMTLQPALTALGSKPAPTIESIVMHTKTQYMAILYRSSLGKLSLRSIMTNLIMKPTVQFTKDLKTACVHLLKYSINAGQGQYALNVTGPILRFFEKYYNVSYPLPKSDFNAGAMENWGLITYRETALLYDEEISSYGNKERIVTVIAHELAHQPDWNIKDLIILNDVHIVFAIDALASSHPLSSKEEEIQRPEQISEVFDTISYSKGASVLRMLSDFLTETVFTQDLDHFKINNTVYTDLWEHLQRAVDSSSTTLPKTVQEIMDRWVLQMGFPVVTINTATGQITQEHFLLDPETKPDSGVYQFHGQRKKQHNPYIGCCRKLVSFKMTVTIMLALYLFLAEWPNCSISYNDSEWRLPLYRAGIIETTLALRTTLFLNSETEYMPWEAALDNLDYFYLMFDRTDVYGPMQASLWKVCLTTRLTNWEDVPPGHTDQYNQVNALRVACSTGNETCTTLFKTWFQQWMENPNANPIKANLRSAVYCSAIAAGGEEEWNFAWEMFEKATVASEKDKLRAALACATEPWLLNRYLKYTLDPEKIRKQDATSTIISIASNVMQFSITAYPLLFSIRYGGGSFSFSNLINGVTNRFSTEFELEQVCDLPQGCFIYFFDCHLVQQKLIFECLIYVPVLKTQLIQFRDDYCWKTYDIVIVAPPTVDSCILFWLQLGAFKKGCFRAVVSSFLVHCSGLFHMVLWLCTDVSLLFVLYGLDLFAIP
uniref:Alanyl (membrane) aminopeptidase b n=1 Tax=Sinocyclocheilus rhinocerous TaxID=307959 RepID=A0A673L9R0_9TELE